MSRTGGRAPAIRGRGFRGLAPALVLVLACGGDAAPEPVSQVTVPPLPSNISEQDLPVQRLFEERHRALVAALEEQSSSNAALALLLGELSMVYHAYDFLPAAAAGYATASTLEPDAMRWWYYRGLLERQGGDTLSALTSLRRALELDPDYVPALVRAGEFATEVGETEAARDLLSRALEIDPACARALAGLAAIDLEQDDPPTAIRRLEQALELQPEAASIRYALALAYRQAGDRARAREELARVGEHNLLQEPIQLDDPLTQAVAELRVGGREHELRGLRAFNAGKYSLAAVEFEQAMAIDPDRIYALHGLGSAQLAMNRLEEAAASFERLLIVEPDHIESRLALARVRQRQGNLDEAERLTRQAAESAPDFAAAHFLLGSVLQERGATARALAAFERALELDPAQIEARFHRLMLLAATSPERAQTTLARDRELLPDHDVLELAAGRLALGGDTAQQRRALARTCAVAARSPTPAAFETVALLAGRLGEREAARRWLALASDAAPGAPPRWSERRAAALRATPARAPAWYPHERLILSARSPAAALGPPC